RTTPSATTELARVQVQKGPGNKGEGREDSVWHWWLDVFCWFGSRHGYLCCGRK
ncbi:unnamed protein product, partial [Ectocarpus fasciculatus]